MDTDVRLHPPSVTEALRDRALTGATREVYLFVLHHLDVARHRPLKVDGVAAALTMRRGTVYAALDRLVALGYVDRGAKAASCWTYRLVWSRVSDGNVTPAA